MYPQGSKPGTGAKAGSPFSPSEQDDIPFHIQHRTADMGLRAAFMGLALCVGYAVVEQIFTQGTTAGLIISIAASVMMLTFVGLVRVGRTDWAAYSLLISGIVIITISLFMRNGLMTPSALSMPLIVIITLWMTGNQFVFRSVVVVILTLALAVTMSDVLAIRTDEGERSPWIEFFVVAMVILISAYLSRLAWDIHQQRIDELHETERQYRTVIENMVDAFVRTDLNGQVLLLSPSAKLLAEAEPQEFDNFCFYDLFPSDRRSLFDQINDSSSPVQGEQLALTTFRGNWRWVALSANPAWHADGERFGTDFVLHDLSEHRVNEERLRRVERIEALSLIAGGVAHDYNNMLGIINGSVGMLQDDPNLSASSQERTEAILRVTEQGAQLTARLREFSGRIVREDQVVSVDMLLEQLKPILRSMLMHQVSLEMNLGAANWSAGVAHGNLTNMIVNLVANARDALRGEGTLTITTSELVMTDEHLPMNSDWVPGEYICLSIRDDGIGMTEEMRDHAIEPFYTTKPRDRGSGLGLSSVFGTLRRIGGDLEIVSSLGEGTEVRLYLPRREIDGTLTAPAAAPDITEDWTGKRILLVDDEPELLYVNSILLGHLGFDVETAPSGDAALARLSEPTGRFHLLISDVVMPGETSGYDLANAARELHPNLAILLYSGFAEHESIDVKDPGFRLLNKPARPGELETAIAEVLADHR